jgi:hypothetical protein
VHAANLTAKLLKVLILLFSASGLALMVTDIDALQLGFELAPLHTALIALGWATPVVMAVLALVRPPLQAWQAAASLAGFAVVAIRTRIWKTIPDFADAPVDSQLAVVALACGLITSVLAVAKPEGA